MWITDESAIETYFNIGAFRIGDKIKLAGEEDKVFKICAIDIKRPYAYYHINSDIAPLQLRDIEDPYGGAYWYLSKNRRIIAYEVGESNE